MSGDGASKLAEQDRPEKYEIQISKISNTTLHLSTSKYTFKCALRTAVILGTSVFYGSQIHLQ